MANRVYEIGSMKWRASWKRLSLVQLRAGAGNYDKKLSKDDLIDIIEVKLKNEVK